MGSVFQLVGLYFLCSFTLGCMPIVASHKNVGVPRVEEGTVVIDGSEAIATIDDDFICATLDWWPSDKCDYGTCNWGGASILDLDVHNKLLKNAVRAFEPLTVRLGGSLQDKVIYEEGDPPPPCPDFERNISEVFGYTQGCLLIIRWDELNFFFKETGIVAIFGLNALNGRTYTQGAATGPWNSSNAASLIDHTIMKGHNRIYAWELGNELSGNGVGTRISAAQYATDVTELRAVIDTAYKDFLTKPKVIAPAGFFDEAWYGEFIAKAGKSVDIVTHHIYSLGSGADIDLVEKILDPNNLNRGKQAFNGLKEVLSSSGTSATAWVGEAGGVYNSGQDLVTNAFVFSFWYLDQLAMASMYDTKTYCRQSLIGGNYGLLTTMTFKPNPDYYSALLFHRLMGRNVMTTSFIGTNKLRAYSHCAKQSKGIVLLLINLDAEATVQVRHAVAVAASNRTETWNQLDRSPRTRFVRIPRRSKTNKAPTREEYHLTAKDGNIQSQTMLLDGNILAVDSDGNIPPLRPQGVSDVEPIIVAPYSIVFVHIPAIQTPACNT